MYMKTNNKSTIRNKNIYCCSKTRHKRKSCIRKNDGKRFTLPRRFTKKQCKRVRGFSMRSSCAPYKFCLHNSLKNRMKTRK
jgi:hypothetical protein